MPKNIEENIEASGIFFRELKPLSKPKNDSTFSLGKPI